MDKPPLIIEVQRCGAQQRRYLGKARPANQIEVSTCYRLACCGAQLHDQYLWAGGLQPCHDSVEMRIAFRRAPFRNNEMRVKAIMDGNEIAPGQPKAPLRLLICLDFKVIATIAYAQHPMQKILTAFPRINRLARQAIIKARVMQNIWFQAGLARQPH